MNSILQAGAIAGGKDIKEGPKKSTIVTCRIQEKCTEAWQVEQDKLSSSERSIAEGNLFKIGLWVQGIPHNTALEDQGRMTKIRESVNKLATENRTESAIADLSTT